MSNRINFRYIKLKNFMSYGNRMQTLEFKNGVNVIEGMNGNGKTVLVGQALHYVLYGKSTRGNLSSLVNNVNKSDLLVEVGFDIASNSYRVVRGISPSKFEIYKNEELIPQTGTQDTYQKILVEDILKIPETVFKSLIYLGGDLLNQSFIKLSKSEKETLFSTLSDTEILLKLLSKLKEIKKEQVTSQTNQKYVLSLMNATYEQENQNYSKAMQDYNDYIQKLENDNLEKINEIKEKLKNVDRLKEEYLSIKLEDLTEEYEKYIKLKEQHSISSKYGEQCKGCEKLSSILERFVTLEELEEAENRYKKLYAEHTKKSQRKEFLKSELMKLKFEKDKLDKLLAEAKDSDKSSANKPPMPSKDSLLSILEKLEQENSKLDNISKELDTINALEKIITSDKLKDLLLKTQLPYINLKVNEFIQRFSNYDFQFNLNQNLKEDIWKAGKPIDAKQMSNGESLRLSMCIMLAFLSSCREKFSSSCNLLILDEVLDSSLDTKGRAELLDILRTSNEFKDDCIYIISHNSEIKDSFDSKIRIEKDNGFSVIVE